MDAGFALYCYCYRSPESAKFVYHDRRVFRLGMKKDRTVRF